MKPLDYKSLERLLARNGFRLDRSSGSHFTWRNDTTGRSVPVPHHKGLLALGTVMSILRQAGLR